MATAIGQVPLEMFPAVNEAMVVSDTVRYTWHSFRWQPGRSLEEANGPPRTPEEQDLNPNLLNALQPLVEVVRQSDPRAIHMAGFIIRVDKFRPQYCGGDASRLWHRDPLISNMQRFVAADCLYTKFLFGPKQPVPGTVIRFGRDFHRKPYASDSPDEVTRTWVQAVVEWAA